MVNSSVQGLQKMGLLLLLFESLVDRQVCESKELTLGVVEVDIDTMHDYRLSMVLLHAFLVILRAF